MDTDAFLAWLNENKDHGDMRNVESWIVHVAIKKDRKLPEAAVLGIIAAFPHAMQQVDRNGDTPLEIVMETQLCRNPGMKSRYNRRAVFVDQRPFCIDEVSDAVCAALIVASPDILARMMTYGDENDSNLLHAALRDKTVGDVVVIAMIETCPAAAGIGEKDGNCYVESTPLLTALSLGPEFNSDEVVLALLKAYPGGANKQDLGDYTGGGRVEIPLAVALQNNASQTVVRALQHAASPTVTCEVYFRQGSSFSTFTCGRECGPHMDVDAFLLWFADYTKHHENANWIKHIIDYNRGAFDYDGGRGGEGEPDALRSTLLHYALKQRVPKEVTLALLEKCPEATYSYYPLVGMNPLAAALEERADDSVVRSLFEIWRDAAADSAETKAEMHSTASAAAAAAATATAPATAKKDAFGRDIPQDQPSSPSSPAASETVVQEPCKGREITMTAWHCSVFRLVLANAKYQKVGTFRHANTRCSTLIEKCAALLAAMNGANDTFSELLHGINLKVFGGGK